MIGQAELFYFFLALTFNNQDVLTKLDRNIIYTSLRCNIVLSTYADDIQIIISILLVYVPLFLV